MASALGSQISLVAYPPFVLALTGPPANARVVGLARTLPVAALAPPAEVLADRLNRRAVMVVTGGVRAVSLTLLAVTIAAGRARYG